MQPLSLKQKVDFAREAIRGGESSFEALCEQHGLDSEELALWLEAYKAGGEPGLRVTELGTDEAPERVMKEAESYLEKSLASLYPDRIFDLSRRGNVVTVGIWERHFNGEDSVRPVFQVRHVTENGHQRGFWLLYWQRINHKWWPYRTRKRVAHLGQALREIQEDTHGCFWT